LPRDGSAANDDIMDGVQIASAVESRKTPHSLPKELTTMPDKPAKYRTVLLFGMPGSGKGTQGNVLGQLPSLVHISCGDVFRKLPKYGTLGREIVNYTTKGALVPDDLTVRIWRRHLQILELQEFAVPNIHTLVLDGLPRNLAQAQMLDDMLDVVQIFHLKIDDIDKAKERLHARALRENRLDDMNEEIILRRIQIYHEETEQTLSFYDPSLIYDIDASQRPIDVLRDIINRLGELDDKRMLLPAAASA
jgi:adenylate kinase